MSLLVYIEKAMVELGSTKLYTPNAYLIIDDWVGKVAGPCLTVFI